MNVTTHRIEEPETTVTLATVGQAMTGAGEHIIAPEGCLTMEQGDFLPWDNPDNILSRQVRAHEYSAQFNYHAGRRRRELFWKPRKCADT